MVQLLTNPKKVFCFCISLSLSFFQLSFNSQKTQKKAEQAGKGKAQSQGKSIAQGKKPPLSEEQTKKQSEALFTASSRGDHAKVKALISAGVNVNATGKVCFCFNFFDFVVCL